MNRKHKKKIAFFVRSFATTFVTLACIAIILTVAEARASKPDREFVQKASIGNQFEIEASRLALDKSSDDAVKEFAQHMVDDHTQMGNQLKTVLSDSDAAAPMPNNQLDPKHQKVLDRLSATASGRDFDRAYILTQRNAHTEAISLFSDYSAHGGNTALKSFATQNLPIIEQHKKHIPQEG